MHHVAAMSSSRARRLSIPFLVAAALAIPASAGAGSRQAPATGRAATKPTAYKTKRVRIISKLGDRISHLPWVSPARRIPMFSAAERKAYEVTVQDGRLYYRGKLLNTEHPVDGAPKATYIFVMAKDGTIYTAPNGGTAQNIHHSSFLHGAPAAAAGTMVVVDGVVQKITNKSGHYGHRAGKMRQVLAELEKRGVDTERVETSFKKRPGKIAKLWTTVVSSLAQKLHLAPREE
jgi:hypothetical protein